MRQSKKQEMQLQAAPGTKGAPVLWMVAAKRMAAMRTVAVTWRD